MRDRAILEIIGAIPRKNLSEKEGYALATNAIYLSSGNPFLGSQIIELGVRLSESTSLSPHNYRTIRKWSEEALPNFFGLQRRRRRFTQHVTTTVDILAAVGNGRHTLLTRKGDTPRDREMKDALEMMIVINRGLGSQELARQIVVGMLLEDYSEDNNPASRTSLTLLTDYSYKTISPVINALLDNCREAFAYLRQHPEELDKVIKRMTYITHESPFPQQLLVA